MKNIWLITKTYIKRNIFAVCLAAVSAGILCFILFSFVHLVSDLSTAKINLGVIDLDKSILSKDFKEYLTEQLDYKLLENYTYDELSTELIDKNISVIIEIPENFYEGYASGNQVNLIVTSLEDFENAAFLQLYMNSYLSSIQILAQGAEGDKESFDRLLSDYKRNDIKMAQSSAMDQDHKKLNENAGFINSIGFYLMFIYGLSVIIAFMILDDRISGVFNRIQATPVKPIQYIVGTGIFGLLLCLIQIAIYTGYIMLKEVQIGVPIWTLVLLMSLFSLFTITFSLTVSLAFHSKNALTSIIIGFSTVGCILGGAYFPLELAPKTMQNFSRIMPQYWFMDALRDLQADITANITPNIIILALYAILFLLIGAVLFAQNYKKS